MHSYRIWYRMPPLMVLVLVLGLVQARAGPQLPSARSTGETKSSPGAEIGLVQVDSQMWWAKVGSEVYFPPDPSTGLSGNIKDYYYAAGSSSALTPELQQLRVGGNGRWHIFHLPGGPAGVSAASNKGTRRQSLSALVQLTQGVTLGDRFPAYMLSKTYANPLAAADQKLEADTIANIKDEEVLKHLQDLTDLPHGQTPTRSYNNKEASEAAQAFIKETFSSFGLKTCLHSFNSHGTQQANVVGFIQGSGSGTVTVGAHYDSRPFAGLAPGAEDNGSGVAALLTMAKAFTGALAARGNHQPKHSVYFVGFAAEEAGLWGSDAFADALMQNHLPGECKVSEAGFSSFLQGRKRQRHKHRDRKNVNQAIIMDEVGWQSPKLTKPTVNLESYDWAHDLLEHLAASSRLYNADTIDVVHSSNPFGSDHMSWLDREWPAVLTINGDDEAYPAYHSSEDTIEKVSISLVANITKMNFAALMRMAL